MFQRVNDRLAIAGALTETDLAHLIAQDYRTIIDLRSNDEPVASGLRPAEERQYAAALGVPYQQIPIVITSFDALCITQVRAALSHAAAPVVLHCASGRRAGILALVHLGCQEGWSADRCLSKAPVLGLDLDGMPLLRDLLVRYVVAHPDVPPSGRPMQGGGI